MKTTNPVVFLGDTHGLYRAVFTLIDKLPPSSTIIQVGDGGFEYPDVIELLPTLSRKLNEKSITLYKIKGNHEYFPYYVERKYNEEAIKTVAPNIFHVRDGETVTIEGVKFLMVGGASSIDYKYRTFGIDMWHEENMLFSGYLKAMGSSTPDMMVTHTPPNSIITRHFSQKDAVKNFNIGWNWVDQNAVYVNDIWNKHGKPPLVCGHMHRSIRDENVYILDINEVLELDHIPRG